eukprot:CAMPEP_0176453606 /NCGR_PEP_ID=MMETSP0127-20121128/29339_1 /TAXON_ID=938130 /ORGANISM="Platyophrya macrostoma, Strain WH" /LENGTH=200 /DNA_ID=CAMNT_0017842499 /DNA_START=115 /DNA_END=717 /DNA_ORIENTATION=+
MPRSSKNFRGEVKPSKFKTSLCQFFLKGETCPFSEKCAFAHGNDELRSEQQNLEDIQTMRQGPLTALLGKCCGSESCTMDQSSEIQTHCETAAPLSPQLIPCNGSRAGAPDGSSSGTTPASDCATPPFPAALDTPRSDAALNFSHASGCNSPVNSVSNATVVFRHNPYSSSGRTIASPMNTSVTASIRRPSVASSNSSSS